jgi:tRNA pseudouridine38-40 synthase
MENKTYRMLIAYDGTEYCGFQMQPNAISIQEMIEKALFQITRKDISIIGSGRTDAGVHALRQVAHFKIDKELDSAYVLKGLNGILPQDIRVLSIEETSPSFHAQKSATSKVYQYRICPGPIVMPTERLYCLPLWDKIDLDLLDAAKAKFIGKHDFTSFSNKCEKGACKKNPVRTIFRIDTLNKDGLLVLEFEGDGFLYKMVRNIVGALLEVATGRRPLSDIDAMFEAKDRKKGAKAAAAKGLFLVRVHYPE